MSNYFRDFPQIQYPDGVRDVNCTDIMIRYRMSEELAAKRLAFYPYTWKEGDRPDKIAKTYYGDANYSWLVLLSNQAADCMHTFPMTDAVFAKYIDRKYGYSVDVSKVVVHHYEDADGDEVDVTTYNNTIGDKKVVYVFDYETDINDSRRKIRLISKEHIMKIKRELYEKLSDIKGARA